MHHFKPIGGAHAHDAAHHHVGGGDGGAEQVGRQDGACRGQLRIQTMDGTELIDTASDGLYNAPAPQHGAHKHDGAAANPYPQSRRTGGGPAGGGQRQENQTDNFLGVVGAVVVGQGGGDEPLELFDPAVGGVFGVSEQKL
ncbi:hypothetical protein SDC9_152525 [bioreactor metagenome]|uniref:Uncharacterized protein n=1 Tax=bioreactor metagenome TaxID=1076179 RepID=A0A645ETC2_9ZZZZ